MELLNIGYMAWNILGLCLNDLKLVYEYENVDIDLKMRRYRIMSQSRTSYVILHSILLVVIVGVVVGLLLIVLAELNSRGCYMYRGGAAEVSVDIYELS